MFDGDIDFTSTLLFDFGAVPIVRGVISGVIYFDQLFINKT